jgi:hypothetical protein
MQWDLAPVNMLLFELWHLQPSALQLRLVTLLTAQKNNRPHQMLLLLPV